MYFLRYLRTMLSPMLVVLLVAASFPAWVGLERVGAAWASGEERPRMEADAHERVGHDSERVAAPDTAAEVKLRRMGVRRHPRGAVSSRARRGAMQGTAQAVPVTAVRAATKEDDMLPVALDAMTIWHQPERLAWCAITFDDGPTLYTSELLDALAEEGVRATFFLLGKQVRHHPAVVRRMYAEGHEVAIHSFSHPNMRALSRARQAEELDATLEALQDLGIKPRYFRPPYGNYDDRLVELVRERDLRLVLWTTDSKDWKRKYIDYHDMPNSLGHRMDRTQMRGVFLFHDTRYRDREDVRQLLQALREDGCERFVTVREYFSWPAPARPQVPVGTLVAHPSDVLSDRGGILPSSAPTVGRGAGTLRAFPAGSTPVPLARSSLAWRRHQFLRGQQGL